MRGSNFGIHDNRCRIITYQDINFFHTPKKNVLLILRQQQLCMYVGCGTRKLEEYKEDLLINLDFPRNIRIRASGN